MFLSLNTSKLSWLKAIVLCTLALTTKPVEGKVQWQSPVNVTRHGGNTTGMQVAPYTDGGAIAIWSWFNGTNYVIQSSLIKQNGTWKKPVTLSLPGTDAFFPQIAIDSKGNAIAVWVQKINNILAIHSANKPHNKSWDSPSIISDKLDQGDASLPQIAFNKKGKAHVVWQKKMDDRWIIQYATKAESCGMLTDWSNPKNLSSKMTFGIGTVQPQIAIDPIGDIYVIWNNISKKSIEVTSQVANKKWSTPEIISDPNLAVCSPKIACDKNGNAVALWNTYDGSNWVIQSATHLFRGGFWSAPVNVSLPGQDSSFPVLAVDKMGNATSAWQTMQDGFSVIQTSFLPFGGIWSNPKNLTTADQDATEAQVITAPKHREVIVWKRSNGSNFVIQAAIGKLGVRWSLPKTLSSNGQDAVAPQVAADNSGNITVTWMRSDGVNTVGQAAYGTPKN